MVGSQIDEALDKEWQRQQAREAASVVRGLLNTEGIKQIIIYMLKSIYIFKKWEPSFTVKGVIYNSTAGKHKYSEVLDWNRLHQYKLTVLNYI